MKGERGHNPAFDKRIFSPGTMKLGEILAYFKINTEPRGPVIDAKILRKMSWTERREAEKHTAARKKSYEQQVKFYHQKFDTALQKLGLSSEQSVEHAEVATRLAMLIGAYFRSDVELPVTRVDGKEPYIEIRSSDGQGGPTTFIKIERQADGELLYMLGESDIYPLEGSFANVQNPDAYLRWVNTMFEDPNLQAHYRHSDAGTFEGTDRQARRATVSLTGTAHSKEEATKLYQAHEIAKRLVRAVEWQIPQIIKQVTNSDWNNGAITMGGEMYLTDFVQEKTFETITNFFASTGPEAAQQLRDVNARLTKDGIEPYVVLEEFREFFGRQVKSNRIHRLDRVALSPYTLPQLQIKNVNLWAGAYERGFERHNQLLAIPPEHQIDLAIDFYRSGYRTSFDIKDELIKLLDEWFRSKKEFRGKGGKTSGHAPNMPRGLREHLAVLGITIDELQKLSLADQKKLVKSKFRAAAMAVHPDRNKDNPNAEAETKRVLAAKSYFEEEKHFPQSV